MTVSRLSTLVHHGLGRGDQAAHGSCCAARPATTPSGFTVGQEEEIVAQVEELAAAGVDYFIFNMPTSGLDAVRRAGELLAAL